MRKACAMIFDLAIAVVALCFIVFAVLAYLWEETPVFEYKAQSLLRAAKIVRFSDSSSMLPLTVARAHSLSHCLCLIAARRLTAVTILQLERGATVGLLE